MTGVVLSDDLIFSSRITATARAHNLSVVVVKSVERLLTKLAESSIPFAILDLNNSTLNIAETVPALRSAGVTRIVAYCSHVDVERIQSARQSGCDLVMARSQFVAKLETDLPTWFGKIPLETQG